MQHSSFRKEKNDLFTPPQGSRVCVRTNYLLSWCSMLKTLQFDMQHKVLLSEEEKWLGLLTPPQGRGCVFGQIICYHVASCVVGLNLICNMTITRKSLILTLVPHPKSTQEIGPRPSDCLICFIAIAPLPAC